VDKRKKWRKPSSPGENADVLRTDFKAYHKKDFNILVKALMRGYSAMDKTVARGCRNAFLESIHWHLTNDAAFAVLQAKAALLRVADEDRSFFRFSGRRHIIWSNDFDAMWSALQLEKREHSVAFLRIRGGRLQGCDARAAKAAGMVRLFLSSRTWIRCFGVWHTRQLSSPVSWSEMFGRSECWLCHSTDLETLPRLSTSRTRRRMSDPCRC
jgi:hypothetical protein